MKLRNRVLAAVVAAAACWMPLGHASLAEDFNDGRTAFRNRDIAALQDVASRLDGTPLAIYGRYWPVALDLSRVDEQFIRDFLRDYPSEWLSDRVRLDYSKRLARSGRWTEFRRESALVVEGDDELSCFRLQQRLNNKEEGAFKDGLAMWFTGRQLPESCNPVFDALLQRQLLTREKVWKRIQLAMDANEFGVAQYLNRIFPAGQGFENRLMLDAINKPAAVLEKLSGAITTRAQQEMALAAVGRLARTDPARAASALQVLKPELSATQLGWGWARVGLYGARRHDPAALSWFAQADLADLGEEEREWYVRAALRAYQWDLVARVIRSMPPVQQAQPAWRYWLGRALKIQGQPVEANRLFSLLSSEHHFYGLLAREELDTVIEAPQPRVSLGDQDVDAIASQANIQRALALFRMDARAEAVKEWNWATRKLDDRQLIAAAELARREGWYDRAIYAADRTRFLHDFSLRYLAPYRDVTRFYAQQVNLDEAWVYGLIRQESRFVTRARSGVGAAGLMQLMPATASWVARKLGLRDYSPASVNEIGTNVQLGTYYLRHVLDQLGSQPVLATAAYNAGPGRARAWQASAALEGAIYAETIPFSETRDYVKKVMANAQYYSLGLGTQNMTLKQRLGTIPARP